MRKLITAVVVLAGLGAALSNSGCKSCTLIAERPIEVEVRDSISGQPLADSASAWMARGSIIQPLEVVGWTAEHDGVALGTATVSTGRYTVVIEVPGYRTWQRAGVDITKDECGFNTARILARLQRVGN